MTRPVMAKTQKALALLDKIHPKYPNRRYTVFEAAAKTGTALSTIYRHLRIEEARNQATKEQK